MLSMSIRGKFEPQDPEGVEAINAIDEFERKNKKKLNRYPKNNLEQEDQLDSVLKKKIALRSQATQIKLEKSLGQYSQKRLARGFKSVRQAMGDGCAVSISTTQPSI